MAIFWERAYSVYRTYSLTNVHLYNLVISNFGFEGKSLVLNVLIELISLSLLMTGLM